MIARATVSPPTPESKTPIGASVTAGQPRTSCSADRFGVRGGRDQSASRRRTETDTSAMAKATSTTATTAAGTSTALLTDRYELTMLDAALRDGTAHRRSVFEVFSRRLAGGRRYGVLAGTGRVLDAVQRFRFAQPELEWLAAEQVVSARTID